MQQSAFHCIGSNMAGSGTKASGSTKKQIPVTILCGFLGAGKTTLLEHILQTKHANGDDSSFKCAVIVNDMAELNIDEEAIKSKSTAENDDKVISMKNGCICCDLQSDLALQIIQLAAPKTDSEPPYDYILIEASGVSEPSEIARIFVEGEEEEQQHDHASLPDVARLDTCVTVVDCHDFLQQLEGTVNNKDKNATSQLLVEQIEYANVILLNKTDLVQAAQLEQVQQRVAILNPNAKLLQTNRSEPLANVADVLDTKLFSRDTMSFLNKDAFVVAKDTAATKDCCQASAANGQAPCCGGNSASTSERSIVTLATPESETRHSQRFGITSFLYQSRFPFHPERFDTDFLEKYFVVSDDDEEDDEGVILKLMAEEEEEEAADEPEPKKQKVDDDDDDEKNERILEQQVEAAAKQNVRQAAFGMLLRSKGFLWLPHMHDFKTVYSQAGSRVSIESGAHRWTVLQAAAWNDGDAEQQAVLRKHWEGQYGDRRQELVFIGIDLKPKKIQALLDSCLLTQEEFDLGIDGWKAKFGDAFLD